MGHGHVTPNPDGSVARCGGPALCKECAIEKARKTPLDWRARDAAAKFLLSAGISHQRHDVGVGHYDYYYAGAVLNRVGELIKLLREVEVFFAEGSADEGTDLWRRISECLGPDYERKT